MKKWIKQIGILLAAIALSACGSGGKNTTSIDTKALAEALVNEISYDDTLEEIPSEDISIYMNTAEGAEGIFYKSSGSTAEEVAVFACKDADTAKATYDNLQTLIDEQEASFEAYDPEEVDRLKNAYLKQRDNYVVLCVSGDSDAAKDIVNQAFE